MSDKYSISQAPIADPGPDSPFAPLFFDVAQTIISQYANSPVLLDLLGRLNFAIDQQANLDAFYDLVWNVDTAVGYGLDVWGRIVGVNRVLRVPADVPYLGWSAQATAQPWGYGIWYGTGTTTRNYTLTDDAFRRLVLAKAALNISDGSIPSINAALMALFPDRGNCYVRVNGGMSMTYVFGAELTPVEYAIIQQSGVLPKPIGVAVSGEVAS